MDELETQDGVVAAPSGGKLAAAGDFIASARREMDKVSWPTRDELTNSTRLVVTGALGLAMVIGLLDLVLNKILIDGVAMLSQ